MKNKEARERLERLVAPMQVLAEFLEEKEIVGGMWRWWCVAREMNDFLRAAAFEEKPMATGRIQGVRHIEGQCCFVVGSLDAQNPQFGEIVTVHREGHA